MSSTQSPATAGWSRRPRWRWPRARRRQSPTTRTAATPTATGRTFVAPLDAGAFTHKTDKAIVLSPFGATRKIECQGDGHYVQIHVQAVGHGQRPHDRSS